MNVTVVERGLLEFQFSQLRNLPLIHGMSGHNNGAPAEGDIAYSSISDPTDTTANRRAFFAELGLNLESLTLGRQVHGNTVHAVVASDRGRGQPPSFDGFPDTDGLITAAPDITLGVITGDCVPIVLYDPRKHVLAVIHAGWRGTVSLIAKRAVEAMKAGYQCRPRTILAGIGPSICPSCYEVGDEVVDAWMASGIPDARRAVLSRDGSQYFDLWTANRYALMAAGVQRRNIEDSAICTRCESHAFFSRRAAVAGDSRKGSQMMVAQLAQRS
jgi:YfiH family protein